MSARRRRDASVPRLRSKGLRWFCGKMSLYSFRHLEELSLQSLVFSLQNADKPLGLRAYALSTVLTIKTK